MFLNRGREIGVTLMEMLLAATLLTVLTGLVFGGVLPALKNPEWFSGTQDPLRNFIVARKYLQKRLRSAKPIPYSATNPSDVLLEYQRSEESDTAVGQMLVIDLAETAKWADRVYQLKRLDTYGVVDTDENESFRKGVWRLEKNDTLHFSLSNDLRELQVQAEGVKINRHSQSTKTHWKYQCRVRIR